MAASENDALPNGKVGGIGDVVRDIPPALAAIGHQIDVVTPGYQAFSKADGAEYICNIQVSFAGRVETVKVYKVPALQKHNNVTIWVLENTLFAIGGIGKRS